MMSSEWGLIQSDWYPYKRKVKHIFAHTNALYQHSKTAMYKPEWWYAYVCRHLADNFLLLLLF